MSCDEALESNSQEAGDKLRTTDIVEVGVPDVPV